MIKTILLFILAILMTLCAWPESATIRISVTIPEIIGVNTPPYQTTEENPSQITAPAYYSSQRENQTTNMVEEKEMANREGKMVVLQTVVAK